MKLSSKNKGTSFLIIDIYYLLKEQGGTTSTG
jgi:hypothetical protein